MPRTVANQNIIHINKPHYTANFLQVGLEEVQEVVKKFNKSEVALYLYLCGNANGFDLALSQVAFENAYGFKKSAYYTAFGNLEKAGYLVKKGNSNIYDFYTTPKISATAENKIIPPQRNENSATAENFSAVEEKNSATAIEKQINKEINNNKQIVSAKAETRGDASVPAKSEEVVEVSTDEAKKIIEAAGVVPYINPQRRFNINGITYQMK